MTGLYFTNVTNWGAKSLRGLQKKKRATGAPSLIVPAVTAGEICNRTIRHDSLLEASKGDNFLYSLSINFTILTLYYIYLLIMLNNKSQIKIKKIVCLAKSLI